jgi:hypothetical protein
MARPSRKTQRCRQLAASASVAAAARWDMAVPIQNDAAASESFSDDEILLLGDDCAELDSSSDAVFETLFSWKADAGFSLRSVYTGDSRTTYWRREIRKRLRHESVMDVNPITNYFQHAAENDNNFFINNGTLPVQNQGKFVKKQSLIYDEDVQRILRQFVRTESQVSLVSAKMAQWVGENLHLLLGMESPILISSRTAQRWLNVLGLRFGKFEKGLYNDGHERSDVVRYRNGFLQRMASYEKRMVQYVGDFMETAIQPEIQGDHRVLVLVTHDESCFGCNDGRNFCWLDENNRQIRPKGNGRSVMVSAFLCECHGILKLNEQQQQENPDVPADSTIFLKPGANSEGYWKNSDLASQLQDKALPIFRVLHPNAGGLFIFDNSQNHHAKPPDALSVSKMNLKDGGTNQRLMRNGWYFDRQGNRVDQSMVCDDGVTAKGVMRVLKERGKWDGSLNAKEARKFLSEQPDFQEQREWLEEVITKGGCQIDFYPKYHCEFNYIEMFWGAAKAWCRSHCTFNFNDHVVLVPQSLESVSLSKIRKFARKSYRYMDAYRINDSGGNSLTPRQIEYAVKKYRGHRKIPLRILDIQL